MDYNYVSIDIDPNKGKTIKYDTTEDLKIALLTAIKITAAKYGIPYETALPMFIGGALDDEVKESVLAHVREQSDDDILF